MTVTHDGTGSSVTHGERRVAILDGWRGCAIIAVLLGHFITTKVLDCGPLGVELFFVLSGRLMAEILFFRRTPLGHFYFRRVSRIYPAMIFTVTTIALIGHFHHQLAISFRQWLACITLTSNYTLYFFPTNPPVSHIWSLCVEEHLYLLLGIIALLARRNARFNPASVCLMLAIAAMVNGLVQTYLGFNYYEVYWRSDVRGASILIGAAAYLLLRDDVPRLLRGSHMPVVLGFAGLLLNLNVMPDPIKYSGGTICLAICLVLISRAPLAVRGALEAKPLILFGTLSYSIYLWQQPFYRFNTPGQGLVHHLANLAGAVSAGVLCTYAVERPARRLINRLAHLRRSRLSEVPLAARPA